MMTRSSFDGFLNVLWPQVAREVADGAPLSEVSGLLATEAAIGVGYAAVGYLFIRNAEGLSLRHATLDRS